jgi:DNA-binding response OmpR family regulator
LALDHFLVQSLPWGDTYEEICILERIYSGIDDYILKPFGMAELRIAMNKQLERGQLMQNPLIVGELKVDLAKNIVVVKDKIISLGRKELEVMIRLARKAGRYVTADALVTRERISALKRKIELEAGSVLEIKYINGLGYKLLTVNG